MSFSRHRLAIEEDFITRFAILQPSVEVTGENSDFTPPSNDSWVRISLQMADQFKPCINNDRTQTDGSVAVQVFTPTKIGSSKASVIADAVLSIFQSASLDAIEMQDYSVSFIGQDNSWYQMNIFANYRAFD